MANSPGHVPTWMRKTAEELERYLRAVSGLPTLEANTVDAHPSDGWYVQSPNGTAEGRTPWVQMADIVVDCVGKAVILSFTWKEDDPVAAPRYLLPMTTMEADEVTGSDALITRLDLFLDSPWRDANTIDLGNGVSLVVMTR